MSDEHMNKPGPPEPPDSEDRAEVEAVTPEPPQEKEPASPVAKPKRAAKAKKKTGPGVTRRAANTPIRDLARGRLTGRLDATQVVARADLPPSLSRLVNDTVRRTRLWSLEKADVAQELASHFAEGLDEGEKPDAMLAAFGSPRRAAKLIRRAKLRRRGRAWRTWKRVAVAASLVLVVLVGLYIGAAWRLISGKPTIEQNYLGILNASATSLEPQDRAWPDYRAALLELGEVPTWGGRVRPGYAGWSEVVGYLENHAVTLELVRDAAARPGLGYVTGFTVPVDDVPLWPQYEGATGGRGDGNLGSVLLMYVGELRKLGVLLSLDARRAGDLGDGELAADNLQAMIGISEHVIEVPFTANNRVSLDLVSDAVSTLGEILGASPEVFTDRQLRDLAHRLAAAHGGELRMQFEGDYYGFKDLVQRMYTDDGDGDGRLTAEGLAALMAYDATGSGMHMGPLAPVTGLFMAGRREMSDEFERWLNMAEAEAAKPLWRREGNRIGREIDRRNSSVLYNARYPGVPPMMENLPDLVRQAELVTQERDAVLVAIALELHRRRHGAWPAALSELVPDLLPSIPPDRFDGAPIKYRLVDGNPIVYSVGADRDDDRGQQPRRLGGVSPGHAILVDREGTPRADGDWVLWPVSEPSWSVNRPAQRAERPGS